MRKRVKRELVVPGKGTRLKTQIFLKLKGNQSEHSRCGHAREPFLRPTCDGISHDLGIVQRRAYNEGPDERGER
jgi:hypothetical protein